MSLIDFLLDTVSELPLYEQIAAFPPQLINGLNINLMKSIDHYCMKFFLIKENAKEDMDFIALDGIKADTCILFIEGSPLMTEAEVEVLLKQFCLTFTGKTILHTTINQNKKRSRGCALFLQSKDI